MRPYPHDHIAREINTRLELFESTLAKCINEGRITEDGQGIKITNWVKYQSEYERQKPYRQRRRAEYTPEENAARERENNERIAAWEAAHPGRKHPVKMGVEA